MGRIISKHIESPWELEWQYHLPIFLWMKMKQRRYNNEDDIFSLWDSDKKDVDQ